MAEDWDLHAVVRGCVPTNTRVENHSNVSDEFLTNFDSLAFENNDFLCYDSGFNEDMKFQGLEEIYTSYRSPQQPQSTLPYLQTTAEPISPRFYSPPLQSTSRGRKNQQAKVVREMTHEELKADSWAWRKYGQKPIKGSPYPRNYYRCSTSKSCVARKQVEKSPMDPSIYIVSYSGDHSHPRPTHRNSLAGSTRNKSLTVSVPSFSTMEERSASSREIYENGVEMEEEEEEILTPNHATSEDLLMEFEELGESMNNKDGDYSNYCSK